MTGGGERALEAPAPGVSIIARGQVFILSEHAAIQMRRRRISIGRVQHVLNTADEVFPYYHDFEWKTGYHLRRTGIFVATIEDKVVTVFEYVTRDYVTALRSLRP